MMRLLRAAAVPLLLAALGPGAPAQVDYALAFAPGGDGWQVEVRLQGRGQDALDFWVPLWTPGAYHRADFGRFVRTLAAADEHGRALSVERPEPGHFVLRGASAAREIVVRYEGESISRGVFGRNVIDVEANRIRADYAYVNPASLLGFVPARAQEPVRLRVALPQGWQAATALERDAGGGWRAASYLRLEDSPLLFSPALRTAAFTVDGKAHEVAVHGRSEDDAAAIAAGCQRLAAAASTLMGGLPYDHYCFLFAFVPEGSGSGLEHSFSTLILLAPKTPVGADARVFWDIAAHEYFHLWCAERLHVAGIHAPDLTRPFTTGTLWFNEGITEYFARHLLLHAGFLDEQALLRGYLGSGRPAGMAVRGSWTDTSRAASDWRGSGDLMQFALRMYTLGPRTIFALDMTMRRATAGERGVLDLLRYVDRNYAQKDRGFAEDELDDILEAVAGPEAAAFYRRCIDGPELPDPAAFLEVIGYRLVDGELAEVERPTEAQLRARKDYFSSTGRP